MHAMTPALARVRHFLVDRVSRHLPSAPGHRKVFLARDGAHRLMTSREDIEALAEQKGYFVVRPELLPIPEQIALFRQARAICGEYGSALHGSLFADAGLVVCGLKSTGPHPGFVQSGMGGMLGQPTGYVFGQALDARRFHVEPADFLAADAHVESLIA